MEPHRLVKRLVAEAKVDPPDGFCRQRLRHLQRQLGGVLGRRRRWAWPESLSQGVLTG